jgi:tyrosine phenol-lyase
MAFLRPGTFIPMNYHFTTTKAHFNLLGATVLELFGPEALITESSNPFKGNMDLGRLKAAIDEHGAAKIPFVRMEATTNLIGGQPFSMANLREVKELIAPLNSAGARCQPDFGERLLHSPARAGICG